MEAAKSCRDAGAESGRNPNPEPVSCIFTGELVQLSRRRERMSQTETEENSDYDPFWITGKDLDRYFSLENALLEFSRLFKHEEKNDRGLVIVGAAFLDTLLENI